MRKEAKFGGWRRFAVVAGVAVLLAAAYAGGLVDLFRDTDRLRDLLTDSGPLGPAAFVLGFALLHTLGVPALAFIFVASLLWPAGWAILLSWVGAFGGAMAGFMFARWLGRDWVAGRLPDRFRRYDERLAAKAIPTVIVVRLATFLAQPADWFFGVSGVRTREFAVGTAIGIVPAISLVTIFGEGFTDWFESGSPLVWLVGAAAAAAFAGRRLVRRRRRARAAGV